MALISNLRRTAVWATGLLAPLVAKTVEGAVACFQAPAPAGVDMSYMMWCDPMALLNNVTSELATKCGAFNILTAADYNDFDSSEKRACDFDRDLGNVDFGVNAPGVYAIGNSICGMIFGASYSVLNLTTPSPCIMDVTQQTLLLNHTQFPNGTMQIKEQYYYNGSVPTPAHLPSAPACNANTLLYVTAGLFAGAIATGVTLFVRQKRAEQLAANKASAPFHKLG